MSHYRHHDFFRLVGGEQPRRAQHVLTSGSEVFDEPVRPEPDVGIGKA